MHEDTQDSYILYIPGCWAGGFQMRQLVNINGEPVQRSPWEYPYSYERFCVWKGEFERTEHSAYSDRLFEWDPAKFNDACQAVWNNHGQSFCGRKRGEIQRFLSLYYGHDVVLTGIEQCCNVATGFPLWIFYWRDKHEEEPNE